MGSLLRAGNSRKNRKYSVKKKKKLQTARRTRMIFFTTAFIDAIKRESDE